MNLTTRSHLLVVRKLALYPFVVFNDDFPFLLTTKASLGRLNFKSNQNRLLLLTATALSSIWGSRAMNAL